MRDLIGWLVGGGNTQKTQKSHILNLKVVGRRLGRSQRKLENQQRVTEQKVRKAIQKGDMDSARMYAKDVVRSKKWALGYQSLISKIDGLSFKLERAEAVQSIAGEMKGVAGALRQVNMELNLPEIDTVVNDMNAALEGIEDKSEIMEDAVDGLFEMDTNEADVDSLLQEYGADIGVSVSTELPTPSSTTSELEAEIAELRKEEE
ncbi:MAG: Snf7 family protein [Candidatus Kariarchaeaceae archaeon]